MEELLNKLIEKGWKPFGDIDIAEFNQIVNTFVAINYESKVIGQPKLRQIVSKESGLWQFVCENGMVRKPDIDRGEVHNWNSPNHWLCESALKDESELEDFLLQNINVEGK